ncbi:MAG: LysM peptidoglycan-binding domain-containing protein [Rhodospirillales bacterium]|nr:LysM peptidoglycan-binding domain-containing protein [Rhodospirillales bacterium]MCB9996040.1 LysM peptidoglycan-binding domain-containing protein [Rhodospirillales bacterium]
MTGGDLEKSVLKQEFDQSASGKPTPALDYFDTLYENELNESLAQALRNLPDTPEQSRETITALLDQGADPNVGADISNAFVAHQALGHPDVFDMLRERGMDPQLMQRQVEEEFSDDYPIDNVKTSLMDYFLSETMFMSTDMDPDYLRHSEIYQNALIKAQEVFPDQNINMSQIDTLNDGGMPESFDHPAHMILEERLAILKKNDVITETQTNDILRNSPFYLEQASGQTAAETLSNSPDRISFDHDDVYRHPISQTDTIESIAHRYQAVMNAETPEQAAAMIAKFNGIDGPLPLDEMGAVKIPLADGTEMAQYEVQKGNTLWGITDYFNQQHLLDSPYGFKTGMAAVGDVATLNGIEVTDIIRPGQTLNIPIFDDYSLRQSLKEPKVIDGQPTTLIVAETGNTHHAKTFSTAHSASKSLDPSQSGGDVIAMDTHTLSAISPEMVRAFETAIDNGEDIVVSISASNDYNNARLALKQQSSRFNISDIKDYEYLNDLANKGDIVVFASAGNSYEDMLGHNQVALAEGLGKNSVIVGAAKEFNGKIHVEEYSSPGADVLGRPLTLYDGQNIGGTSYSTPDLAAVYKELNEFYGGTLEPNEIIAAGYMSTNLELIDDDYEKGTQSPIQFETNGAGRPYHFRAGAGMIDEQRWNENLEKMATIKRMMQHEPDFIEHEVNLKENGYEVRPLEHENASEYVYKIPVPEDMTLDKITLIVPQEDNARGEISIRSPSGFEVQQPYALTEMSATTALALEDVKAGDEIELRSSFPFKDEASITVRGYQDGNAVQALRDHLQENDLMPKPHSTYVGGELAQEQEQAPEPPAAETPETVTAEKTQSPPANTPVLKL